MTPRDLVQLSKDLAGRSEAAVTEALRARHLSPEEKIAVRHQIQAQAVERRLSASLATDRPLTFGELAPDRSRHTPETLPLGPEMRALFRKARLDPARSYSQAEVDQALAGADVDVTSKIAIRTELDLRRQVRASGSVQASRTRDLTAAAERPRGQVLRDKATGKPLVLRIGPH